MNRILRFFMEDASSFAWSKQLSIGNAILDMEHKDLIANLNNVVRMIDARDGSALADAFGFLEDCLTVHFKNEQMFAESIGLDFAQHQLVHQILQMELQNLMDEWAEKHWACSDHEKARCFRFFRDCLIGHIRNEDMQVKPALQDHPYDYIPAEETALAGNMVQM